MFKIAAIVFNTYIYLFSKIAADSRTLPPWFCTSHDLTQIPDLLRFCIEFLRFFCLKQHWVINCVQIRLVLRPNILSSKLGNNSSQTAISSIWQNLPALNFAEKWILPWNNVSPTSLEYHGWPTAHSTFLRSIKQT